jgi:transposase
MIARRGVPAVKRLCLDEITPHKGHGPYYLIISAPELGLVLEVLKDRKKTSLEAWFAARGPAWCAQVTECCADMWDAYHAAARVALPNARLVVDRFHLAQNLSFALSQARRAIQKAAPPDVKAALKGARWLLVKNRENLTVEEGQKLEAMLALSPELKTCYDLKEDLRAWFNADTDRATAATGLTAWLERAHASGLQAWRTFVKTVQNWQDSVLNYFDGRHNNGFAEGVNLKIKLLNRRAFGYRNFNSFRLHILAAFGP